MNSSKQLADKAAAVFARADAEGRELTMEERSEVQGWVDAAQQQKDLEHSVKQLDPGDGKLSELVVTDGSSSETAGGGWGDAFVRSEGFKRIADPGRRGQSFTTGAIEVGTFQTKAGTVLESGQGVGLVPVPQVIPGQVEKLFEPLSVASVIPSANATGASVRYVVEGTATSGAAGVAEGATKPASDFAYSTVDEPVRKIATSLTTSDEILDDVSSVQVFLNSRLTLFVRIEEERQLLRGGGTNELVGIIGRSGVNTYSRGTADDNAVAIGKVIANTRGSSFLEPDTVVMHPNNWLATRLLTDGNGQFYGGGPFTGAYGNAGAPGLFGESIWGKRLVLSSVVGAGTALVGSFGQAAQVFRRGAVTVEATNSHSDYFVKNLVAMRAEERLALAVYRPSAFTIVSGLS